MATEPSRRVLPKSPLLRFVGAVLAVLVPVVLAFAIVGDDADALACSDTGSVDALAMRSYRIYDTSQNLIPDLSEAEYIFPGDEVPDVPLVLIENGTSRPFIVRAAAQVEVVRNQNVTADLWVHTTGRVCNFLAETHEHVDTHPNTGEIRRDFYKWKYAFVPGAFIRVVPHAGWHRFDLWQQRSNGSTIMDIHCCGAQRDTGLYRLNAEVSWVQN